MLGKLIKYEFRATSRLMLAMFLVFAVISSVVIFGVAIDINEIISYLGQNGEFIAMYAYLIEGAVFAMYLASSVFMCTLMFFYGIKRFHDGLLGHQGYIMHLLPVKTSMHIIAKGAVALIWHILGILAVIASWCLFICWFNDNNPLEILSGTFEFFSSIDIEGWIMFFLYILGSVIWLIGLYMRVYASMAIGYSFNKYRLLITVAVYFGVDFIIGIVTNTISVTIYIIANAVFPSGSLDFLYGIAHITTQGAAVMMSAAIALAYFFVTNYFLTKRLNLQ